MASKKQTFEEREKAAGLFGTMSGREQRDNRGTYSQINSAQANYKNALENSLGERLTQSQVERRSGTLTLWGWTLTLGLGICQRVTGKLLA